MNDSKLVLGGGCFWCLEAVFQLVDGVKKVTSGYAGGQTPSPTYEDVCAGSTSHAEVVEIIYDSSIITYKELLSIFFSVHNPTTKNRQGNDVGTQYRSIVLFSTEEEKFIAKTLITELNTEKIWKNPIVTELKQFNVFYVAEKCHQNYYKKNTNAGYCRMVIEPKLNAFRKKYLTKANKA